MNNHQKMVREFHKAIGVAAPDSPTLTEMKSGLRVDLILEEANEFREAVEQNDWPEMIDAIGDLLYVVYGAAVEMGVDMEPFFREIHRTNMAKTGGPIREDGKLLKPKGWRPPDIQGLLDIEILKATTRTPPKACPMCGHVKKRASGECDHCGVYVCDTCKAMHMGEPRLCPGKGVAIPVVGHHG